MAEGKIHVVAHIERGQGYLVGGGHYHAEVYLNKTSENENVLIEIRPTEEGLARIAKRKAAQNAGSATASADGDKA